MIPPPAPLLQFPPNRVWRTYQGGRTLDELAARAGRAPAGPAADGHFPEDWIASTTRARNPADATRFPGAGAALPEGLSLAQAPGGGPPVAFAQLLQASPRFYLGAALADKFGPSLPLLVKLLDPAMRLHLQVHPTAEFARRELGAPSGKTEAYHILAVREDLPHPPYIYLGFQRPPTRAALRDMIARQDVAALEACFDRVPVQVGDTVFVPGGVPHALGPGLLLVEIMEPSDLVVRCEFSRGGYTIPEEARFLGRDLEFCLDVFDASAWPAGRVFTEAFCPPRRRRALGPDSSQDDLIGLERTPCFRVRHSTIHGPVVRRDGECWVGVVTSGAATLRCGDATLAVRPGEPFFVAAEAGPLAITPQPGARILECLPPAA